MDCSWSAVIRKGITRAPATIWRRVPSVLLAWVIAALAVRLTIRDCLPILSVLFYMTPLLVSAVLSGVAALIWLRRRCWRLSGLAGELALMSLIWFHVSAHAHHLVVPGPTGERIVFWNAAWRDGATETLQGLDADLAVGSSADGGGDSVEVAGFCHKSVSRLLL